MNALNIDDYMKLPSDDRVTFPPAPWTDKELEKVWRYKTKYNCFSFYSGGGTPKCARCASDDLRILCLDHINSDGAKMRKELMGDSTLGGCAYYAKLEDLGYPDGHQVLCHNCHHIIEYERRGAKYANRP